MTIPTDPPTPNSVDPRGVGVVHEISTLVRPSLPLGPSTAWVSLAGRRYDATLLDGANRYLIVAVDPDEAPAVEADLEAMRIELSQAAAWDITSNEPKLGCIAATDGTLRFRVRQNPEQGWHPGMAASAMVMLATAAGIADTVVSRELGGPHTGELTASTPGGSRSVSVSTEDDLVLVTYELSPVTTVVASSATRPTPGSAA